MRHAGPARKGSETRPTPADTASPGPQLTHPQPPRLNSYRALCAETRRSKACRVISGPTPAAHEALTSNEARLTGSPRRWLDAACSPSRMAIEGTWPALGFRPVSGPGSGPAEAAVPHGPH